MKTRDESKKTPLYKKLADTLATTAKQLVWLFSLNGIAWIWCSYVLAFMGKEQIAEALSSNVCTVVLGQIGFYLITKTVENVFRYNNFGGPRTNYKEDNIDGYSAEQPSGDYGAESIQPQ